MKTKNSHREDGYKLSIWMINNALKQLPTKLKLVTLQFFAFGMGYQLVKDKGISKADMEKAKL